MNNENALLIIVLLTIVTQNFITTNVELLNSVVPKRVLSARSTLSRYFRGGDIPTRMPRQICLKSLQTIGIAEVYIKRTQASIKKLKAITAENNAIIEKCNAIIKKQKAIIDTALNLQDVDPFAYQLCLEIKKAIGIDEPVMFKVFEDPESSFRESYVFNAFFHYDYPDTIFLNRQFLNNYISRIKYTVVHELEHYRQHHQYSGSYHGKDSILKETGADAAAAGFFDCFKCLQYVVTHRSLDPNSGYFDRQDYDPYLQRLQEEGTECQDCQLFECIKIQY